MNRTILKEDLLNEILKLAQGESITFFILDVEGKFQLRRIDKHGI